MIPAYIATRRSIPKFGRPAKRAARRKAITHACLICVQSRLPRIGVAREAWVPPAISVRPYGWHGSCLRNSVAQSNPRLGTES